MSPLIPSDPLVAGFIGWLLGFVLLGVVVGVRNLFRYLMRRQ